MVQIDHIKLKYDIMTQKSYGISMVSGLFALVILCILVQRYNVDVRTFQLLKYHTFLYQFVKRIGLPFYCILMQIFSLDNVANFHAIFITGAYNLHFSNYLTNEHLLVCEK